LLLLLARRRRKRRERMNDMHGGSSQVPMLALLTQPSDKDVTASSSSAHGGLHDTGGDDYEDLKFAVKKMDETPTDFYSSIKLDHATGDSTDDGANDFYSSIATEGQPNIAKGRASVRGTGGALGQETEYAVVADELAKRPQPQHGHFALTGGSDEYEAVGGDDVGATGNPFSTFLADNSSNNNNNQGSAAGVTLFPATDEEIDDKIPIYAAINKPRKRDADLTALPPALPERLSHVFTHDDGNDHNDHPSGDAFDTFGGGLTGLGGRVTGTLDSVKSDTIKSSDSQYERLADEWSRQGNFSYDEPAPLEGGLSLQAAAQGLENEYEDLDKVKDRMGASGGSGSHYADLDIKPTATPASKNPFRSSAPQQPVYASILRPVSSSTTDPEYSYANSPPSAATASAAGSVSIPPPPSARPPTAPKPANITTPSATSDNQAPERPHRATIYEKPTPPPKPNKN
jgi:hypothetical protein